MYIRQHPPKLTTGHTRTTAKVNVMELSRRAPYYRDLLVEESLAKSRQEQTMALKSDWLNDSTPSPSFCLVHRQLSRDPLRLPSRIIMACVGIMTH